MSVDNPIPDLLAAPLHPDWTVDQLAEAILRAIATRASGEDQKFVIDAAATTDRQSLRVLRPLLACLAIKSAAEAGTSSNLYGGRLSFERPGREGPVRIFGHFENTPGRVRILFGLVRPADADPRDVWPAWTDQRGTIAHGKESPAPAPREDIIPTR